MIITYLGKQFFKIQRGNLIIAINPVSKKSKLKESSNHFGANIALSTINHPYYNGFENASYGETIPFKISGPGDYEIQSIFINGVMTEIELDGKKYINTIYSFSLDNISVCFLGVISNDKITSEILEHIDTPDILFIPIGNEKLMLASEAYKLAVKIGPKIIIPMDYNDKSLESFLKEGSQETVKPIEKLTIKAKDISDKEGEIVVLSE